MAATVLEPGALAVSLAEVKAYLRIDHDAEDALLAGLVRSATGLCEAFTGQTLLARQADETIPASGAWRRLSLTPVRSIGPLEGLPPAGAAFLLPADAYGVDIDANGDGWVRVVLPGSAARVKVGYSAGMGADWNGIPEALRQGIVRLVGHFHAHRDAAGDAGPPAAVTALWRPWRRMRLR